MSNFLAVLDSVPHCHHGGGGITAYAAVCAMRENGNSVNILVLSERISTEEAYIQDLEDKGIHVDFIGPTPPIIPWTLKQKFFPELSNLFPSFALRKRTFAAAFKLKPDAIFCYHWDAIASTYGLRDIPRLGLVGDPVHLPFLFRKEFLKRNKVYPFSMAVLKEKLFAFTRVGRMKRAMRDLLADCDISGAFAAHHAEELKASGVSDCRYFRTPIPDPAPPTSRVYENAKLKILHIGHLQGIATLSGVELLAKEVIPALSEKLGPENFEVHIVGGNYDNIPKNLKLLLQHPSIRIRGQISPPNSEFLSSHIVVVPTPIELGIRVRIVTAFSFGSCVVVHSANKKGIPEIKNDENALVASTGRELAEACIRAYADSQLRTQVGLSARKTYEELFSVKSAGAAISAAMDEIVHKRKVK